MTWHAHLALNYALQADTTTAHFTHSGPLRILQSLYPEGSGICHNVLVHPPGGLVGGDSLTLEVAVAAHAHGLVTTPGATRFYRSEGASAIQRSHLSLAANARLEWLPLEGIAYSGCLAENHLLMNLAPGAELIGWDITALGLPSAQAPFVRGSYLQHIEIPGVWLDRGRVAADDTRLLNSPMGLAGQQCMATLFLACGSALTRGRLEQALQLSRQVIDSSACAAIAGATSPNPQVVVVRLLAPMVEPTAQLLRAVRNAWRTELWDLPATQPRIWAT
jgi:urease accessory protein